MTSRRVRNRTRGEPHEPRSTSSRNGRKGSGTWRTISGWSQYVKACRCGPVRYRRGFTLTVYPVAVGSPRRVSRTLSGGWVARVDRTAMGPRGRPDARKFFTYQLYGPALRYRAWAQRWPKIGRFARMRKASFERERVGRADREANRRR